MNRRVFIAAAGGLLAVSCSDSNTIKRNKIIELGPISTLPEGPSYHRLERLTIQRRGNAFRALSLVCSHQECLLIPQNGQGPVGFVCPCHGATFSPEGDCLSGPAVKPLTAFTVLEGDSGQLRVDLGAPCSRERWFVVGDS